MSLLDKATIITTPTAHSNGVLHSIKGGSVADFDVVRGSAATRVNAEGLIEDISTLSGELVTNGGFDTDSNWTKNGNISISGGSANFIDNGSNLYSYIRQNISQINGKKYLIDFEIKNYSSGSLQVILQSSGIANTYNSNGKYSIVVESSVSNGYVEFSRNFDGGTFSFSIENISVKEVIDATNIPRIDYTDGTASILLEPQSTNILEYSEDFISGNWAEDDVTILSDLSISPSGESNSSILVVNTVASRHNIKRTKAGVNTATLSIFAKAKELSYIQIASANSSQQFANFDLSNGTIGSVGSSFSNAKIEDYGNGWYRCSVVSDNQYNQAIFSLVTSPTSSWLETWTSSNNTDGLYIYGAQLEELPYATSYIPTNGAIATRLADSVTGAGDATTFNSTEGVLYFEGSALTNGKDSRISLSDGTLNNRVSFAYAPAADKAYCIVRFNGVQVIQNLNVSLGVSQTDNIKVAIRYKSGDSRMFINGVSVVSSSVTYSSASPALSELKLKSSTGGVGLEGKVKSVITFDTALTDAELECLTTI